MEVTLKNLVFWCGIGHFGLSAGSLLIPKVLDWKSNLAGLKPLFRQMFWTYAAYILVINFCFGLVSVLGTSELLDHSFLAAGITLFISVYWFTRIVIQFAYFDRSDAPKGLIYTLGEALLVGLFIAFAVVYLAAFAYNQRCF
jgi:hypothetical protein